MHSVHMTKTHLQINYKTQKLHIRKVVKYFYNKYTFITQMSEAWFFVYFARALPVSCPVILDLPVSFDFQARCQ